MSTSSDQDTDITTEILFSLRSIIEPLFIYHQIWQYGGIPGEAFRRRLLYWREPSIDATLYGLEGLHELGKLDQVREVTDKYRREFFTFLMSNFVSVNGHSGFRQSATAEPTVYASSMAFNLLRYVADLPYYKKPLEPLGNQRADNLQKIADELNSHRTDFVEKTVNFVLSSQGQSTGGFFDHPQNRSYRWPDMRTTHSAYLLLWNLGRLDSMTQNVRNFIVNDCLKTVENKGTVIGFSDHPDGLPEVSATYYALRMLGKMGDLDSIEKNKRGIIEFLKHCLQERKIGEEETAGFGPSFNSERRLSSTSHALQILFDILKEPDFLIENRRLEKIQAYVKACQSQYGGFKFGEYQIPIIKLRGKQIGIFSPNLYMTRHMIRTAMILKEYNHDVGETLSELIDERLDGFLNYEHMRKDKVRWANYAVKDRGQFSTIVRLFWGVVDFFFRPSNPNRPPSIIRPIPFYLTHILVLLILSVLWIAGAFNTNTEAIKAQLAPFLAIEAIAILGNVWWFVTR